MIVRVLVPLALKGTSPDLEEDTGKGLWEGASTDCQPENGPGTGGSRAISAGRPGVELCDAAMSGWGQKEPCRSSRQHGRRSAVLRNRTDRRAFGLGP
jgi:hypothetical protein